MGTTEQCELLERQDGAGEGDGTAVVNARCRIQTRAGFRVVTVGGLPLAHYAVGDRMGEAHAMVSLVDQGWAKQTDVARAFGCAERTVRRRQRRFELAGLAGLGRPSGCPRGATRLPRSRVELVNEWKAEGLANREIARRLGVSPKAVRKLVRRLGWRPEQAQQLSLRLEDAADSCAPAATAAGDPNLSGSQVDLRANEAKMGEKTRQDPCPGGDPNLSGSGATDAEPVPRSLEVDPADRSIDRALACLGLLEDAAPLFGSATHLPWAGVLLAIPALIDSGVFQAAPEIYGSIGPAFYGLRTTILTMLLMALLRIKRPEGLKEHPPRDLGQVLGLDRAPEVKTLRRKLARLAGFGRAADFGRALAQRRVAARGHAIGFLYIDGHVRAYHGKRRLPKAHLARMRLSMPATTDYLVNDAEGEPLFVVPTEANQGLVRMLPVVLDEVRAVAGDRRVTVVFDRGGWIQKLFKELLVRGFDILTYRKGRCPQLPRSCFRAHEAIIDGHKVSYLLAYKGIYLEY